VNNKLTGNRGEQLAKQYLVKKGFEILETNYHSAMGEIDIIARKCDTVHFIEVKYRTSEMFGSGREAVTASKQRTIHKLATRYLVANKLYYEVDISFDVIEINGKINPEIEHLEACF